MSFHIPTNTPNEWWHIVRITIGAEPEPDRDAGAAYGWEQCAEWVQDPLFGPDRIGKGEAAVQAWNGSCWKPACHWISPQDGGGGCSAADRH